ncbi:AraC family transcriptional regulator [Paenibacillus gorillae]|uniref:AraC family transcriptional regulator n=1 Tax=Paenibacillus gorillae TaxID=1243662 RepID=UPI0005A6A1F7|nr:helix-turn-helix domain-containing protein [Paenibacillus gorillae]
MNNRIVPEWEASHFPLYTADSIHSVYSTSSRPLHHIHEHLSVLIAIVSGKGSLKTSDQVYEVTEGSVILLPAYSEAELTASSAHPLHAYTLAIRAREGASSLNAGAMMQKSEAASNSVVYFLPNEPAIAAHVEELYVHRLPENEIRHVQNQIIFHQIILQLLQGQEAKYAGSEQPSMERSIACLENHFSEKITREQLAEIAGVSSSHYSILFKQMTGFSPSDYLSRLRVHRAKELLIGGSGTLREIALKVGYKDEFYLSRRFKQQTGASPSGYNRRKFERVAVLLSPYASHLLLLGLEPAIIISDSSEYVHTSDLQPPQSITFININSSIEQVKSLLLEADIELIIGAQEHLDLSGFHAEHLRAIAPVAEVSWMDMGWKEHLRIIAQIIQRQERAEQWLAEFELEEQAARSLVKQSKAVNETITIVVIKPEQLFIYGNRNFGYVIYQSLGLNPPAKVKQQMDKLGDRFHSIPVDLSELGEYAGDRMLVIIFPDIKGSIEHSETVFKSGHWEELPAVRQGNVHVLDLDEWIPYNPISIRLQLQRAVGLFTANQ